MNFIHYTGICFINPNAQVARTSITVLFFLLNVTEKQSRGIKSMFLNRVRKIMQSELRKPWKRTTRFHFVPLVSPVSAHTRAMNISNDAAFEKIRLRWKLPRRGISITRAGIVKSRSRVTPDDTMSVESRFSPRFLTADRAIPERRVVPASWLIY